jgi:hypothetical protein
VPYIDTEKEHISSSYTGDTYTSLHTEDTYTKEDMHVAMKNKE